MTPRFASEEMLTGDTRRVENACYKDSHDTVRLTDPAACFTRIRQHILALDEIVKLVTAARAMESSDRYRNLTMQDDTQQIWRVNDDGSWERVS